MESVGTRRENAEQLARLLADADLLGHPSHGLNRLHIYLEDVANGTTVANGRFQVSRFEL